MSPCSLCKCIGASWCIKHNHSILSALGSQCASRCMEQALCQIRVDFHALCPYGFSRFLILLVLHELQQSAQVHQCLQMHQAQPLYAVHYLFQRASRCLKQASFGVPVDFHVLCPYGFSRPHLANASWAHAVCASASLLPEASWTTSSCCQFLFCRASRCLEQASGQIPVEFHVLCPYGFLHKLISLTLHEPMQSAQVHRCFRICQAQPFYAVRAEQPKCFKVVGAGIVPNTCRFTCTMPLRVSAKRPVAHAPWARVACASASVLPEAFWITISCY